jgi:hypothetical protein
MGRCDTNEAYIQDIVLAGLAREVCICMVPVSTDCGQKNGCSYV